jgi:predicted nuclease with RNAse H fold
VAAGLIPGSIMPPTLTRMAYLTLRGITVARIVATIAGARARIVEVHPGAACVLRGAPVEIVRALKSSAAARHELLRWLEGEGLEGIGSGPDPGDHFVAACAAALAAWKWSLGAPAWIHSADPPWHPYDMAC